MSDDARNFPIVTLMEKCVRSICDQIELSNFASSSGFEATAFLHDAMSF